MSTQPRHVSAADTAALLRRNLQAAHPKVKPCARAATREARASTWVGRTAPRRRRLNRRPSSTGGRHGRRRSRSRQYRDTLLSAGDGCELVHLAPHDVSCHRKLSLEFWAELEAEIADATGEPFDAKPYRVATLDADGTDAPTTVYYVDKSARAYGRTSSPVSPRTVHVRRPRARR
jgi:hypothetical protein